MIQAAPAQQRAGRRTEILNLIWSFVERVVPKIASALATLLVAHYVLPKLIGVYAWGILALTLFQAVTDSAIGQVAVRSVMSAEGFAFLRRYRIWSSLLGGAVLLGFLFVLAALQPPTLHGAVWSLTPLLLVPAVMATRVEAVALLQIKGHWHRLARLQTYSAFASLMIFIPLLVTTHALISTVVQTLVMEAGFSLLVLRIAGPEIRRQRDAVESGDPGRHEFQHVALYSMLGWFQGQTDRLLLGSLAGTATLGLFSISWSISRNLGDGISLSTANVLRPQILANAGDPHDWRQRVEQTLIRAVVITSVLCVATMLGNQFVLSPILGHHWQAAVRAVPVMTVATLSTVVSWSLTIILIAEKRVRWATPVKLLGVAMGLPVALVAEHSLIDASWVIVLREVITLLLMAAICGRNMPKRAVTASLAGTAGMSLLALLLAR